MRLEVVTIFPDYFAPLQLSLIGRARAAGLLDVHVHDLRAHTTDRHRTVDDAPLGGGAGMVMRPEPWAAALEEVVAAGRADGVVGETGVPHLLVPSPAGTPLTQALAADLARQPWLAFACGRYEGIDERVLDAAGEVMPTTAVSLGDYVVNGGEVAVLATVEAVVRLLPGVVGNPASLVEESHADGLLEHPVYTRPATWAGREAPPVLLTGHHARIARWRRDQSLARTAARRPDLLVALDPAALDAADLAVLASLGWEVRAGRVVRAVRVVSAPSSPPAVAD